MPTDTNSRGKQDPMLQWLIWDCCLDDTVQQMLQMIFYILDVYSHRAVVDFLPGGQFESPVERFMASTYSTLKHNKL